MIRLTTALAAAALALLLIAPPALAQGSVTSMIEGSDLQQAMDPQTLANKHYTRGLSYVRKADKAIEKGKPQEKVTKYLESAVDYFQQATGQYYDLAEAHCALGCTLLRLERLEEADSALNVALALQPNDEEAKGCKVRMAEMKKAAGAAATAPGR